MVKIDIKHRIDKGVPIPVRRESSGIPLRRLEVGESVTFPLEKRHNVQSYASHIKKRYGSEFTVRKISDIEGRVWRTK